MLKAEISHITSHDWWACLLAVKFGKTFYDPRIASAHRRLDTSISGMSLKNRWKWFKNTFRGNSDIRTTCQEFDRLFGRGAERPGLQNGPMVYPRAVSVPGCHEKGVLWETLAARAFQRAGRAPFDVFGEDLMKRILFITYWPFENEASNGICKKIRAQAEALSSYGMQVDLTYMKNGNMMVLADGKELQAGKARPVIGKMLASRQLKRHLKKSGTHVDGVYIRYALSDPWFLGLLRYLKKQRVRVLLEIPTYPYDGEFTPDLRGRLAAFLDQPLPEEAERPGRPRCYLHGGRGDFRHSHHSDGQRRGFFQSAATASPGT